MEPNWLQGLLRLQNLVVPIFPQQFLPNVFAKPLWKKKYYFNNNNKMKKRKNLSIFHLENDQFPTVCITFLTFLWYIYTNYYMSIFWHMLHLSCIGVKLTFHPKSHIVLSSRFRRFCFTLILHIFTVLFGNGSNFLPLNGYFLTLYMVFGLNHYTFCALHSFCSMQFFSWSMFLFYILALD